MITRQQILSENGNKKPYKYYYLIDTPYGTCRISKAEWNKGKKPTIRSALDKTSYFINMAKEAQGNKVFEYLDTYVDFNTPFKMRCEFGHEFFQVPPSHLKGLGCPKCRGYYQTKEDILLKASLIHKNIYSYDDFVYTDLYTKSFVTCKTHGNFKVNIISHVSKKTGCPLCKYDNNGWSKSCFFKACEKHETLGTFYIIRCYNENEEFYKLGITSRTTRKRYDSKEDLPYNYEILLEYRDTPKLIWEFELFLKRYINKTNILYKPAIKFKGSFGECFKF